MVDRTSRPIVPTEHSDEREHRRLLAMRASASLPKDGTEGMTAPLRLMSYATADLPDAGLYPGSAVYNSDEDGVQISDGAAWSGVLLSLEEGTWSPAITGSVSNPTVTYTNTTGKYSRIGNRVFYSLAIDINAFSGGSGDVLISLPLVVSDTTYPPGTVLVQGVDLVALTMGLTGNPQNGNAYLKIFQIADNTFYNVLQISALAAGDDIFVSGHYTVA